MKEKQIYGMVDSVKNVPLYQNIYTVISTILGDILIPSMWVTDLIINCSVLISWKDAVFNWDYGPLLISAKNSVYSDIWHMEQKTGILRGGGGLEYMFKDLPTSKLTLSFKHDVVQLGAGVNAFTEGNILSSILSRGNNDRLSLVNQGDISFEQEWRQGVSNTFAAQLRNIFSSRYVPFIRPDGKK